MATQNTEISVRVSAALREVFPESSMAEVARRMGVHSNTLNNYLQADRLPSCEFLIALARNGADVHWILTGEGTVRANLNTDRKQRSQAELSAFSDKTLVGEVDRRSRLSLERGTALLRQVAAADLRSLAAKVVNLEDIKELTDEELSLAALAYAAFSEYNAFMWAPPLTDPEYVSLVNEFSRVNKILASDLSFFAVVTAMGGLYHSGRWSPSDGDAVQDAIGKQGANDAPKNRSKPKRKGKKRPRS